MKKTIKLIGAVACSACLLTTLQFCDSTQAGDENVVVEETNYAPEAIVLEFSAVYDDLSKRVMREYKQIAGSNVDIEDYFEHFSESYIHDLTAREKAALDNIHYYSSATRSGEGALVEGFIEELKPLMYHEDLTVLETEINKFYGSPDFLNLSDAGQQDARIKLGCIVGVRNSLVDVIIDCFESKNIETRMSPGDRMVWSAAIQQLYPDQLEKVATATIFGIGMNLPTIYANIVAWLGLVVDLFS